MSKYMFRLTVFVFFLISALISIHFFKDLTQTFIKETYAQHAPYAYPTPAYTTPAPAVPFVTISANPQALIVGGNSTISWTTGNMPAGVTCSNNWNAFLIITPNTSGSDIRAIYNDYTFTVSCSNGYSDSVAVTAIIPIPSTPTFTYAAGACPAGSENSYGNVTWSSVPYASGYELVRDGYGSFGTGVYYGMLDYSVADSGMNALYYIRAYNQSGSSPWGYVYVAIPDCLTPAAYSINTPISSCLGINSPNLAVGINSSAHANNYSLYHQRVGYDSTWVNPNPTSGSLSIPAFSGVYNFNDATDLTGTNPNTTVHYLVRASNTNSGLYTDVFSLNNLTKDCLSPLINLTVNGSDLPNATIDYNTTALLEWNNLHSSSCTRTSTVEGRSPSNDPNWSTTVSGNSSLVAQGSATTIRHINPPTNTATYTMSCTNLNLPSSVQTSTLQKTITVSVRPEKPPFIDTTGGDVHTQGRIIVPSASP